MNARVEPSATALDPELAPALDVPFPNDIDNIPLTRQQLVERADAEGDGPTVPANVEWSDQLVGDESDRSPVKVRIYRNSSLSTPTGAFLFFHGGAFVFGDLESEHPRCLHFADRAGCLVISVDYRLAPEHPYPAALNDGVTALSWLRHNAHALGVDAQRIAIGGASAGGALASALALKTRDEEGMWLRAQLLIYPALDDRTSSPSIRQFYRHAPWDGERTEKMWTHYLKDVDEVTAYAAPSRATDLSGLPSTYIMTAEQDPLRDEALNYAQRLLAAGVSVEYHHFARTYHGFDTLVPGATLSQRALLEQSGFLRRELASATDGA
jgi:acetyl esterase/lipase